jgi:hypothetical protein
MLQVVHSVVRERIDSLVLKPAAKMTTALFRQNETMDNFCKDEFIFF